MYCDQSRGNQRDQRVGEKIICACKSWKKLRKHSRKPGVLPKPDHANARKQNLRNKTEKKPSSCVRDDDIIVISPEIPRKCCRDQQNSEIHNRCVAKQLLYRRFQDFCFMHNNNPIYFSADGASVLGDAVVEQPGSLRKQLRPKTSMPISDMSASEA